MINYIVYCRVGHAHTSYIGSVKAKNFKTAFRNAVIEYLSDYPHIKKLRSFYVAIDSSNGRDYDAYGFNMDPGQYTNYPNRWFTTNDPIFRILNGEDVPCLYKGKPR